MRQSDAPRSAFGRRRSHQAFDKRRHRAKGYAKIEVLVVVVDRMCLARLTVSHRRRDRITDIAGGGSAVADPEDPERGNGFAFTVRVGGKINCGGRLGHLLQVGQNLFLAGNDDVFSLEIVFDIHPEHTFRQVFNMAERGFDLVFLAEIFVDRLGLGGRLDDD